jgi:hypothetical protein
VESSGEGLASTLPTGLWDVVRGPTKPGLGSDPQKLSLGVNVAQQYKYNHSSLLHLKVQKVENEEPNQT